MKSGDIYIKKTNKLKFKIVKFVDKGEAVIYHEVGYLNQKIQPTKTFLELFDPEPIEVKEPLGFWESRERVKLLAEMDNQPTTDWDVHGSY